MKKAITMWMLMLFISAMLACGAGGAFCESAEPDYVRIGLEVTGLMSEMVDSETYLSMLGSVSAFADVREQVNTHDYDRPVAVYSLRLKDPNALFKAMALKDAKSTEAWNSLPPELQDQLMMRISLRSMCSGINAKMGTDAIAFSAVATAVVVKEALTGDGPENYLYIFEEGTPILVSFGYHSAAGYFLFIPKESQENLLKIWTYLNLPSLEIAPVDLPDGQ